MFRKKQTLTLSNLPTKYPRGTFIETEKGYYYVFSDVKRYKIISKRVLDSWAPPRIVPTTEAAVKQYKVSSKLKFRNGSFLKDISTGQFYLIEDSKRRHMVSPESFENLHITYEDAVIVSKEEIELHELGEEL